MEVINSDALAYAYTIKTLGPVHNEPEQYVKWFDNVSKLRIPLEYKVGELDSKGKLHYHGIMQLKKGFYRKRLILKGYHLKLEQIYNKKGWESYIHKDVDESLTNLMYQEYQEEKFKATKPLFKTCSSVRELTAK